MFRIVSRTMCHIVRRTASLGEYHTTCRKMPCAVSYRAWQLVCYVSQNLSYIVSKDCLFSDATTADTTIWRWNSYAIPLFIHYSRLFCNANMLQYCFIIKEMPVNGFVLYNYAVLNWIVDFFVLNYVEFFFSFHEWSCIALLSSSFVFICKRAFWNCAPQYITVTNWVPQCLTMYYTHCLDMSLDTSHNVSHSVPHLTWQNGAVPHLIWQNGTVPHHLSRITTKSESLSVSLSVT